MGTGVGTIDADSSSKGDDGDDADNGIDSQMLGLPFVCISRNIDGSTNVVGFGRKPFE